MEAGANFKPFEKVAIIGLGLLGSSLALAVKKAFPNTHVMGISSQKTLEKASEMGLIQSQASYEDCPKALFDCDLVVLCTPINHIVSNLSAWGDQKLDFKKPCVITDVGSTKKQICDLGQSLFSKNKNITFLGSHPMAGSEKTGIEALDPHLFENAPWIICPLENSSRNMVTNFETWVKALGCRSFIMEPGLHDKVVANVSHLPQFLSTALAGYIISQNSVLQNALQVAGGGLRDMTRLADSSYKVWEPIFESNRQEIQKALENFGQWFQKLVGSYENGNLQKPFEECGGFRKKLIESNKGFSSDLAEILVDIPDKPGILLQVLNPVVSGGLNILDLEIIKVREGESGTLRMGFKNKLDAQEAYRVLDIHQFKVKHR